MEEITVANLIRGVEKRQYLLPTIQRGFVWESKKIETLFDSIMRGFPISSFLFWEVPDEDEHTFKFYDFIKDYNFYNEDPRSFAEFKKAPHMAVLDGQQRITSFYIGLKGSYIPKGKPDKPQKLYLNLLKISADSDIGDDDAGLDNVYEFKFLTEDDAAKRDAETFWFPVGKILDKEFDDNVNIADFLLENNLVNANTHSYLKLPYRILNRLWSRIKTKPFIEYHLESNKSLDEVLNIFVRINNGGKPVELSELLISLATAQLKDFDVENEIIRLVNEINNIGGEKSFNVSNDFVLKAFLVLCGDGSNDKESIKFKIENFKPQRMPKIRSEWNKMSTALKSAATLLNEFGFNQRNFTSNNALIPLAHYMYLNENYAADKGKMIHWFISATLNGIFSSGTDEKLARFRNRINESHESFPLKEMLGVKNKSDGELADELVNALMSTTYKNLKNVLMALTILYDGKIDLATVDVDHMFPKIKIKNLGEMAHQGIADESKFQTDYEKFCNALPNLQLLDSVENKKKSSTYFSDWIKNQSEEYRHENFVPDVDFRLVNFKNFVAARGKLIREKLIENLTSHGVIYSEEKNIPPIREVKAESNLFIDGQEAKIADAITDANGKIIVAILYEGDGPMAYVYDKNYKKIRLNSKFAYKIIENGRAVKILPAEFDALKNKFQTDDNIFTDKLREILKSTSAVKIRDALAKDTDKLKKAMNFPDGKIRIRTIISADGTQNFTLVQENFALVRIYVETAAFLVNEDKAILITDEEFQTLKNSTEKISQVDERELKKIIDMARRIKKQFANAFVTHAGKYFFYVNLEFVKLDGSTPNWKPEARIVAEDLSTPRVSWDIIEKDVIPKNLFVEIKKDNVEIARRIAKTNGIEAAFDYLESVGAQVL